MIKPDQRQMREFANLRGSPVAAFLADSLDALKSQLVTQSDPSMLRLLQGRAQAVRDLLTLINEDFSTNGKRG